MRVCEDAEHLLRRRKHAASFRVINVAKQCRCATAKIKSSRWKRIPVGRTCWSLCQIDESIDPQIIVLSQFYPGLILSVFLSDINVVPHPLPAVHRCRTYRSPCNVGLKIAGLAEYVSNGKRMLSTSRRNKGLPRCHT